MRYYNQRLQWYSRMACTIYTLLYILEFNFWIEVKRTFIIKVLEFFDKLWKWSPTLWATFSIIYPSFVFYLNKRLKLNFRLEKSFITLSHSNDTNFYGIWMPSYNKPFAEAIKRGIITKEDMLASKNYKWRWFWHNLGYDFSKWWYIVNTDWSKPAKCSLEVLQYWESLWVFWNPMRTILPNDERTKRITDITIKMARAEFQWKPFKILKKDYDIKEDILKLYNYWK